MAARVQSMPTRLLWGAWLMVVMVHVNGVPTKVDDWPTLPTLDELRGSDNVVELSGQEVMIDITPRKGLYEADSLVDTTTDTSGLTANQELEYKEGVQLAAQLEGATKTSHRIHEQSPEPRSSRESESAKVAADAEEFAATQAMAPVGNSRAGLEQERRLVEEAVSTALPARQVSRDDSMVKAAEEQKHAIDQAFEIDNENLDFGIRGLGRLGSNVRKELEQIGQEEQGAAYKLVRAKAGQDRARSLEASTIAQEKEMAQENSVLDAQEQQLETQSLDYLMTPTKEIRKEPRLMESQDGGGDKDAVVDTKVKEENKEVTKEGDDKKDDANGDKDAAVDTKVKEENKEATKEGDDKKDDANGDKDAATDTKVKEENIEATKEGDDKKDDANEQAVPVEQSEAELTKELEGPKDAEPAADEEAELKANEKEEAAAAKKLKDQVADIESSLATPVSVDAGRHAEEIDAKFENFEAEADGPEPVPELSHSEAVTQGVLEKLAQKVDTIAANVESMEDKDHHEALRQTFQIEADLRTKLKNTLHQKLNLHHSGLDRKKHMEAKLITQTDSLSADIITEKTKERAIKDSVIALRLQSDKLKKENEKARERASSIKTEEDLIGKVHKLETVMASMEKAQEEEAHDARHGSLEARMDHLERRLRRLNIQKEDSGAAAAEGGNDETLKSLAHTLNAAMKVAAGSSGSNEMPDYFKNLALSQKKHNLIQEKTKLEDELSDLQRKHALKKLQLQAEVTGEQQENQLQTEAKQAAMQSQIDAQKRRLKQAVDNKIAENAAAVSKDERAAALKQAALESDEDRARLEYEKAQAELGVSEQVEKADEAMIQGAQGEASNENKEARIELVASKAQQAALAKKRAEVQEQVNLNKIKANEAETQASNNEARAEALEKELKKDQDTVDKYKAQERQMFEEKERNEQLVGKMKATLTTLTKREEERDRKEAEAKEVEKVIDEVKANVMAEMSALNAQKSTDAAKQNKLQSEIEDAEAEKQRAAERKADADIVVKNALADVQAEATEKIAEKKTEMEVNITTMNAKLESMKQRFAIEMSAAREELDRAQQAVEDAERNQEDVTVIEKEKFEASGQAALNDKTLAATITQEALLQKVADSKKRAHQIVEQAMHVLQDTKSKAEQTLTLARAKASESIDVVKQDCLTTQNEAEAAMDHKVNKAIQERSQAEHSLANAKERTARVQQIAADEAEIDATAKIKQIRKEAMDDEAAALMMHSNVTAFNVSDTALNEKLEEEEEEHEKAVQTQEDLRKTKKAMEAAWHNGSAIISTLQAMADKYAEMRAASKRTAEALQVKLTDIENDMKRTNTALAMHSNAADVELANSTSLATAADEAYDAKHSLEKEVNNATEVKLVVTSQLDSIKEQNEKARNQIAQLQATLKAMARNKADLQVATATAVHNETLAEIETQTAKLAITTAQKEFVGKKEELVLAEAMRTEAVAKAKAAKAEAALAAVHHGA